MSMASSADRPLARYDERMNQTKAAGDLPSSSGPLISTPRAIGATSWRFRPEHEGPARPAWHHACGGGRRPTPSITELSPIRAPGAPVFSGLAYLENRLSASATACCTPSRQGSP